MRGSFFGGRAPARLSRTASASASSRAIAALIVAYVLVRGPMRGLGALTKGAGLWTREAVEHTFIEHAVSMSLGWSMHPLIKEIFLRVCARFASREAIAAAAYAVAATVVVPALFACAWRLSNVAGGKNTQSTSDAGYTDGGEGGGGGGDGGFGDVGDA